MTTTLITGANKGLGYEAARRLLAAGHDVWIAARDAERGDKAAEGTRRAVRAARRDQRRERRAAAATVVEAETGLDVLINNAGIAVRPCRSREVTAADIAHASTTPTYSAPSGSPRRSFRCSCARTAPVIVNVSSGLGLGDGGQES